MSVIELKNLTFIYSKKTPFEKRALDDINLSVEEGTFLGVIGRGNLQITIIKRQVFGSDDIDIETVGINDWGRCYGYAAVGVANNA